MEDSSRVILAHFVERDGHFPCSFWSDGKVVVHASIPIEGFWEFTKDGAVVVYGHCDSDPEYRSSPLGDNTAAQLQTAVLEDALKNADGNRYQRSSTGNEA